MLVAAVIGIVSLLSSWWTLTGESYGMVGCTAYVGLHLGGGESVGPLYCTLCATCAGGSNSPLNVGRVWTMYRVLQGVVVAAVAIAVSGGTLGILGARGVTFGRAQLRMVIVLGLLAGVMLLAAALAAALAQPGAMATSLKCSWPAWSSGQTPCSSFWGSNYFPGNSTWTPDSNSWGPDFGWYAAIVGSVVSLLGASLWIPEHAQPFTREEAAAKGSYE